MQLYRSTYIQGYIDLCSEAIEIGDSAIAYKLYDVIIATFENEVETIYSRYSGVAEAKGHVDYVQELTYLRGELQSYLFKIDDEERSRVLKEEVQRLCKEEGLSEKKPPNTDILTRPLAGTQDLQRVLSNIRRLPDNILEPMDKKYIKAKLAALELAKKNKNRKAIIEKIDTIIEFIADRKIEVGLSLLPYLGDSAKMVKKLDSFKG